MKVRSLGYRTDLTLLQFAGQIEDRGEYLVVRTPSNPTYYWGNFLLFSHPPMDGDLTRWRALFAQEIGAPPQTRHLAFGWDATDGETGMLEPFLQAGFRLNQSVVLTASAVQPPPRYSPTLEVRSVMQDAEWESALQNQILCRDPEHSLDSYARFVTKQMEQYRAMIQAGWGAWFAAFLGDRVVGDLGVFVQNGVGRFQAVETHPEYRRQGICSTLVYQAARYALENLAAKQLVMVADAHYHAAHIYESVGFAPTEKQVGIDWWEHANP